MTMIGVDMEAATIPLRNADGTALILPGHTGASTLANDGAFPLRTVIAANITVAMILDKPRTANRTLELRLAGSGRGIFVTPAATAAWHTAGTNQGQPPAAVSGTIGAADPARHPGDQVEKVLEDGSSLDRIADDVALEDDTVDALNDLDEAGVPDAVPTVDEHDVYEENGRFVHDGTDEIR